MISTSVNTSAKIIAFPARGRFANAKSAIGAIGNDVLRAPLPVVDYGNWYHQAAIEDDRADGH